MAVSLAAAIQDADARRSVPHAQGGLSYVPVHEYVHQDNLQTCSPATYNYQASRQDFYPPSGPPGQSYDYGYIPAPPQYPDESPPRPPKIPLESLSTSSQSIAPLPMQDTMTIEPDPLPPHSNPQALTTTQSQAFEDSKPIPPVRIATDKVWDPDTGHPLYFIVRETTHLTSFFSTKPLLTVRRTPNGLQMGDVRFPRSTSNIDLTINGKRTSISHSGKFHNRWGFHSTTVSDKAEMWYWRKDRSTGGAVLEDAKRKGHSLARMKGDLLAFEQARLSSASYEEVLLSAIAMAEAARRQQKTHTSHDIGLSIGDFASSVAH